MEEIENYPLIIISYIMYRFFNSENQQIEIEIKTINVSGVSVYYDIFTRDNDISKYPH